MQINKIDIETFKKDISHSKLIESPNSDLNKLVEQYNMTMSELLDTHAPRKNSPMCRNT